MPRPHRADLDADALIEAVIDREGRYVNHPADRGGATCWGITEAVARAEGYVGAMRDRLGNAPAGCAAAVGGVVYIRAFAVDDGIDQGVGVEFSAGGSGHDSHLRLVEPTKRTI